MSEAYGWNPETGAYQKISKMNVFRSGKGGSGKFITISKRLEPINIDDTTYYFQFLRLNLIGFTNADVGKKIFLYKIKVRNPERLVHPRDCFDTTHTNIAQLGCGVFYYKPNEEYIYNSTYQTNEGLAQTEWTITNQNIINGYLEINLSQWIVNLLFPNIGSYWWAQCTLIGGTNFWFALEDDMTTLSEQITILDPKCGSDSQYIHLDGKSNSLLYYNGSYYLAVKWINYTQQHDYRINKIGVIID